MKFIRIYSVFTLLLFVFGCGGMEMMHQFVTGKDTPVQAQWISPSNFSSDTIFTAAIKAGMAGGFQIINQDRQSGIITLVTSQKIINLAVFIEKANKGVLVKTSASVNEGGATKEGKERYIRSFYSALFTELNIKTDGQDIKIISDNKTDSSQEIQPAQGNNIKTDSSQNDSSKTNSAIASPISMSISQVQKRLFELGYNIGKPDGVMGKKTVAALKKFQQDNNLSVTGQADSETIDKLSKATTR